MENLDRALDWFEAFFPFLAVAAMLAAIVVAINVLGRRLEKHDDWLRALDARLGNLHKGRAASWAQHLARPFEVEPASPPAPAPLVPPPLPPRAPTLDAVDWEEELVETDKLMTQQTGRYPLGEPPKGPNDDDR